MTDAKNESSQRSISHSEWREIWAFRFSAIAVVVSLLSVAFSIWVYQRSQQELLEVHVTPRSVRPEAGFESGNWPLLTMYWDCILLNVGNRPLSVVDYNVRSVGGGREMSYTGLDGGLATPEGNRLNLPIVIGVGESSRILVKVGLKIDSVAAATLAHRFEEQRAYNFNVLQRNLFQSGLDFYGNEVTPIGDSLGFSLGAMESRHGQHLRITFATGKGTKSSGVGSLYSVF